MPRYTAICKRCGEAVEAEADSYACFDVALQGAGWATPSNARKPKEYMCGECMKMGGWLEQAISLGIDPLPKTEQEYERILDTIKSPCVL